MSIRETLQSVIARAAGVAPASVWWADLKTNAHWTQFPRVRLDIGTQRGLGLPVECTLWDTDSEQFRTALGGTSRFEITARIEDTRAESDSAPPLLRGARFDLFLRSVECSELLKTEGISIFSVNGLPSVEVPDGARMLSVSVFLVVCNVGVVAETTPDGGADYFTAVESAGTDGLSEWSETVSVPEPVNPEPGEDFVGLFSTTYPLANATDFRADAAFAPGAPFEDFGHSGRLGDGTDAPRFFVVRRDRFSTLEIPSGGGLRAVMDGGPPGGDALPLYDGGGALAIPLPVHDDVTVEFEITTNLPGIARGDVYWWMGIRIGIVESRTENVYQLPRTVVGATLHREWGVMGANLQSVCMADAAEVPATRVDASAWASGATATARFRFGVNQCEYFAERGPGGTAPGRVLHRVNPYPRGSCAARSLYIGHGYQGAPPPTALEWRITALTVSGARY